MVSTNRCTSPGNIQERLQKKNRLKNTKIFPNRERKITGNTLEKICLEISCWLDGCGTEGDGEEVGCKGVVWNNVFPHTLNKHSSPRKCSQVAVAGGQKPGEDKIAPVWNKANSAAHSSQTEVGFPRLSSSSSHLSLSSLFPLLKLPSIDRI